MPKQPKSQITLCLNCKEVGNCRLAMFMLNMATMFDIVVEVTFCPNFQRREDRPLKGG